MTILLGTAAGAICVYLALENKRRSLSQQERQIAERAKKIQEEQSKITEKKNSLDKLSAELGVERSNFDARIVSYSELQKENVILKQDLSKVETRFRKLRLDGEKLRQAQKALDARGQELGNLYLKDSIKWNNKSLSTNNFVLCKQRLKDTIERVREVGLTISSENESALVADLKADGPSGFFVGGFLMLDAPAMRLN